MPITSCPSIKVALLASLGLLPMTSPAQKDQWSLASPDGQCEIAVHLNGDGRLSCQVSREGKVALPFAPLGLVLEGQNFENALRLVRAGRGETHRERYDLFAGVMPHVDGKLRQRTLEFSNASNAVLAIDLAVSDEGVTFR